MINKERSLLLTSYIADEQNAHKWPPTRHVRKPALAANRRNRTKNHKLANNTLQMGT